MATGVQINPRMLAWARETAGLSPAAAAAKLGLKTTAKATAAEKLLAAESGERPVGRGLLQKAAAAYQRPLITFYLPEPPAKGERGQDFRSASDARSPRNDAMLDALVRDVRARQQRRDPAFDERKAEVLDVYAAAHMLRDLPEAERPEAERPVAVVSYDEKPGIQAPASRRLPPRRLICHPVRASTPPCNAITNTNGWARSPFRRLSTSLPAARIML